MHKENKVVKKTLCLIVFGLLLTGSNMHSQNNNNQSKEVRLISLMTYNLKFASPTYQPSWEVRRKMQVDMIRKYSPDIIGTQEGLKEQI